MLGVQSPVITPVGYLGLCVSTSEPLKFLPGLLPSFLAFKEVNCGNALWKLLFELASGQPGPGDGGGFRGQTVPFLPHPRPVRLQPSLASLLLRFRVVRPKVRGMERRA